MAVASLACVDPVGGRRDLVRVRGHVWAVLARTRHTDCEAFRLRGAEAANAGEVRTLLAPFDRPVSIAQPTAWRTVRPRRWLHGLRRMALDAQPIGGLRTADESRIDLLPYQLEPAIAILRHGATRLLIADDVGLGKTIQAGLILRELATRNDGFRAIIVMPAGLRDQWRQELRDRFDLATIRADAIWLLGAARELPPDVNPWSLPGVYISSYDFVKRAEVLRPLEDVTWDLVVFDEAHAAAPATDRRMAADAIASRGRRIVLLTATPHSGDPVQFEALCRLGRLGDDREPPVMFVRSRADAGAAVRRRTALLTVRPSPAERRMHRLLERYASRIHREAGRDNPRATLAAIVLRKRALSSAGSLLASVTRRQELLAGRDAPGELQLALPLDDEDQLADDVGDPTLAVPGLGNAREEQRVLTAIVDAARTASIAETKTAFLLRLLRRVKEPVIVFTEYRDTLTRLSAALRGAGLLPQVLHGGMSPDERAEAQRAFNVAGTLLLATDAASEGLNLHHRCRAVVHYELPWSPVRLQQRTGRVDRIGQTRAVHEILLVAADTAERLVLAPLFRRATGARHSTAGASRFFGSLNESRIAAAVLEGDPLLPETIADERPADGQPAELRDEASAELRRLEARREWRARSALADDGAADRRPLISTIRGRHLGPTAPSTIFVFVVALHAPDGCVVHSELVPASVAAEVGERQVHDVIAERFRAAIERVGDAHRAVAASLERRERDIASVIPEAATQLVQAGLFDRRAVKAADERRRQIGGRLADARERIDALGTSGQLTTSIDLRAKLTLAVRSRP
jgi:superfamily II DNA or RNA helicase